MIDKERLIRRSIEIGMPLIDVQAEKLNRFAELLVEANKTTNLTRIESPNDILEKHFIDCLYAAKYIENGSKVIDIGSGAGFPSIVIAIAKQVNITMLDSIGKKLDFIYNVCNEIGIDAELLHTRAEIASRDEQYREKYDYVTARAVSRLDKLCEYCIPFVEPGGRFIAMKGAEALAELEQAKNAIEILNASKAENIEYILADGSERRLIIIDKTGSTDSKYPRTAKKIDTQPL